MKIFHFIKNRKYLRSSLIILGWLILIALAFVPYLYLWAAIELPKHASSVKEAEEEIKRTPLGKFENDTGFDEIRKTPKGTEYMVNQSHATFDFDINKSNSHSGKLFRTYAEAFEYLKSNNLPILPSVFLVRHKTKTFDDRLLVSLEKALQNGIQKDFEGKQEFLRELLAQTIVCWSKAEGQSKDILKESMVYIGTALSLGGINPEIPNESILKQIELKAFNFKRN